MNLLDLQREYNEKQLFIKLLRDKIKLIDDRMENITATDIRDVSVLGHAKKMDINDLLNEKYIIEEELNETYEELGLMLPVIKQLEEAYEQIGDRDKQIYIQRRIWGYSPVRIGIKWGIDERTVRRIVKKVEKNLNVRKCPGSCEKIVM